MRQALKANDLRNWTPESPMLLCAGNRGSRGALPQHRTHAEPLVFGDGGHRSSTSIPTSKAAIRTRSQKEQFAAAKAPWSSRAATTRCSRLYHAGLVAPFCLSAVKSYFDGF